ncbi:protein FAM83F-like [Chanos chanos]|uniref:Protein FAM83F-like n=1 Tax=Chanos chanos TaxID=29144 RepID=A0A6J2W5P3_CHACN|nr:protein FAM83F-like [Chanos chanos]
MAESQLVCMEDGLIQAPFPESRPEFYYSESHRVALETLLKEDDGAFKLRLNKDNVKDFLSAREIKWLRNNFLKYKMDDDIEEDESAESEPVPEKTAERSSSMRSTYWPERSDTDIPPLDIGWASGGKYKGVTRVNVYTHPPKESEPHIKQVVRKLIQEAQKVVAVVMDLLTDLQIIQDLMDAAFKRRVAVYIILDVHGAPHFLDMCHRLDIGANHLQNMRARTVNGFGFNLSFGKIPGNLCYKYMIVDGEKVMFGSYSFSWCTSRVDRNMITVMTGAIVDFYDNDFRELYAISDNLDLFKEFHISKPSKVTVTRPSAVQPKRPTISATSRFQVTLGDSAGLPLNIPDHKYHNPIYSLLYGHTPGATGSLRSFDKKERSDVEDILVTQKTVARASSDKIGTLKRTSTVTPNDASNKVSDKKPNALGRLLMWFKRSNQSEQGTAEPHDSPPSEISKTEEPAPNSTEDQYAEQPATQKNKGKKFTFLKRNPSKKGANATEEKSRYNP